MIFLVLFLLFFSSCASSKNSQNAASESQVADVVLKAVPLKVKVILEGSTADAVDQKIMAGENEPRYIVIFKIKDIVHGEFTKVKVGGPNQWQQAGDAVKTANVLKVLTLDFKNPGEEVDKTTVSVAVMDPEESFGITSWDSPEQATHLLSLKRDSEQPNSYVLSEHKKIKAVK